MPAARMRTMALPGVGCGVGWVVVTWRGVEREGRIRARWVGGWDSMTRYFSLFSFLFSLKIGWGLLLRETVLLVGGRYKELVYGMHSRR